MIKVENKKRHMNAESHYYYTQDRDGKDYLFSGSQLEIASERAKKNPEDLPISKINFKIDFLMGVIFGFAIGYVISISFFS